MPGSQPTYGWYKCPAISARRLGIVDDDSYAVTVTLNNGRLPGYRVFQEENRNRPERWMFLVLDDKDNIVGQVWGETGDACRRKMNAIFRVKGLGDFSGYLTDGVPAQDHAAS